MLLGHDKCSNSIAAILEQKTGTFQILALNALKVGVQLYAKWRLEIMFAFGIWTYVCMCSAHSQITVFSIIHKISTRGIISVLTHSLFQLTTGRIATRVSHNYCHWQKSNFLTISLQNRNGTTMEIFAFCVIRMSHWCHTMVDGARF